MILRRALRSLALLVVLLLALPQIALADYEGAVTPGSAATRSALIGCVNNTVLATASNGQQVAVQCDTSGRLITTGSSSGGSNSITGPTGNNIDAVAPTATGQVPGDAYNYGFNGTNWDRIRTLGTTSPGILGIGISPDPSSVAGITPVVSSTTGTSLILKGSPGNLYSVYAVNSTATSGLLIIANSATVPGTGVLTAGSVLDCVVLAASGSASINYNPGPMAVYGTGITALLSSASNCFTFTTSGGLTGFIKGATQ